MALLIFRFFKLLTVQSYGGLSKGKIIIIAMEKVAFFNANRYNFTDFLTSVKSWSYVSTLQNWLPP